MSTNITPEGVEAAARAAGLELPAETAVRIATAIAPAFALFAPVAGTLPFDLEPAAFLNVQRQEPKS